MTMNHKFLIIGDTHLTNRTPKNRTDDCPETQKGKMVFIFDLAKKEKVSAILQPGDLVDHYLHRYNTPDIIKREWIIYFKENDIPIFTVPGQHDMRYHSSDIKNTPMGVLEGSGVINVMTSIPLRCFSDIYIYGAGWNAEIPKLIERDRPVLHILITHRMIIKDKKIWEKQTEFDKADSLLSKHKFDLIVSGDNHQSFIQKDGEKILVNCGSLMRSKIDQVKHQPCAYIYNTKDKTITKHLIPIKPFEDVMNIEAAVETKEKNKKLDLLIEGLSSDEHIEGLDFKKAVISDIKENKDILTKGTVKIINEEIIG